MSSKFVLVLGFVAMSTMALGCGDSGSSGTGGTRGTGEVPGDPDASWVQLSEMTFEEIIPGIVSFATPWGDLAAGPHATFARVFAGTGTTQHAMNCVSDSMDCLFLLVQDGAFDVTFLDI